MVFWWCSVVVVVVLVVVAVAAVVFAVMQLREDLGSSGRTCLRVFLLQFFQIWKFLGPNFLINRTPKTICKN